jgi:hypothetical protein
LQKFILVTGYFGSIEFVCVILLGRNFSNFVPVLAEKSGTSASWASLASDALGKCCNIPPVSLSFLKSVVASYFYFLTQYRTRSFEFINHTMFDTPCRNINTNFCGNTENNHDKPNPFLLNCHHHHHHHQ